jgi:hypothetical protein
MQRQRDTTARYLYREKTTTQTTTKEQRSRERRDEWRHPHGLPVPGPAGRATAVLVLPAPVHRVPLGASRSLSVAVGGRRRGSPHPANHHQKVSRPRGVQNCRFHWGAVSEVPGAGQIVDNNVAPASERARREPEEDLKLEPWYRSGLAIAIAPTTKPRARGCQRKGRRDWGRGPAPPHRPVWQHRRLLSLFPH